MSNGYSLVIDRSTIAVHRNYYYYFGIGNFQYGLCLMAHSVAADRHTQIANVNFYFSHKCCNKINNGRLLCTTCVHCCSAIRIAIARGEMNWFSEWPNIKFNLFALVS